MPQSVVFAGGDGSSWPLAERPIGFWIMRVEVSRSNVLCSRTFHCPCLTCIYKVSRDRFDILPPIQLSLPPLHSLHILRATSTATQDAIHHLGCWCMGPHLRRSIFGRTARSRNTGCTFCSSQPGPRRPARGPKVDSVRCPARCSLLHL